MFQAVALPIDTGAKVLMSLNCVLCAGDHRDGPLYGEGSGDIKEKEWRISRYTCYCDKK